MSLGLNALQKTKTNGKHPPKKPKKTLSRSTVFQPLVLLKVRHIVQSKLLSAAFSTFSSECRPWQEAWNHLQTEEKVSLRARYVKNKKTKILVETSSPELAGSVETLHTCHIGGTAELWCLHCRLLGRWDMLQGWHRGHTGCNYSATHTSSLGWWHHTGYRTHTCRTQGRQRSF